MTGALMMVTTHRDDSGTVVLAAVGELDLSTIGGFASALQEAVSESGPSHRLTLDLRGVEYLDSAAINLLFAHAEQISLIRVNPLVLRGLTISGLDQVVEIRQAAAEGP